MIRRISVLFPAAVLAACTLPAATVGPVSQLQWFASTAAAADSQIAAIAARYNEQELGLAPGIRVQRRAWFNPNLDSGWHLLPGLIASLSMIQTMLLAALSVAREREQGTFDQLLVTPLTPLQILIGKALPAMLVGLLQSSLVLLIIRFWFQVPMAGSLWLLYLGLLAFNAATVGVGLSVSALSLTMQQAMLYNFMLVLPMTLLSGLMTPVRNMPQALQTVTHANPLRFGVSIVRRVYLEGATLADVAPDFLPLLAMTALSLPLAALAGKIRCGSVPVRPRPRGWQRRPGGKGPVARAPFNTTPLNQ